MKKLGIKIVAILAMLLFIFVLLITSFEVAIYGDKNYQFYEKEYEKYDVLKDLDMEMKEVMKVTSYMMDYLRGREQELSIETKVEGVEQDFFNEQDRLHMADVQNLFLKGLLFRNVAVGLCILLLLFLLYKKAKLRTLLPKAFGISFLIIVIISGIIGSLFYHDFTKYFTIFHEIFFTNDLWLFDYDTDYMIRMLPEGFFNDFLVRIGVVFSLFLIGTMVLFGILFFLPGYKFTKPGNCGKLLKDKDPN